MDNNRLFRATPQLFIGLVVIAIGVLFTLDNLDVLDASRFIRFWPALLVAYGIIRLADTANPSGKVWGIIAISVGALMLLDRMDFLTFRFRDWWPLILVGIGGSMLFRSLTKRTARADTEPASDSTVSLFALLGGFERTNSSQDFRGGDLTAVMGGCELDLRRASLKGEAVIDIFAFWGGVGIKVPEDWSVSVRGFPVMGAIEDKTHPPKGGSGKLLVVKGYAIMGGAEITN